MSFTLRADPDRRGRPRETRRQRIERLFPGGVLIRPRRPIVTLGERLFPGDPEALAAFRALRTTGFPQVPFQTGDTMVVGGDGTAIPGDVEEPLPCCFLPDGSTVPMDPDACLLAGGFIGPTDCPEDPIGKKWCPTLGRWIPVDDECPPPDDGNGPPPLAVGGAGILLLLVLLAATSR